MKKVNNNGAKKEAQFGKLWALLPKDPVTLSKDEINRLLKAKEDLKSRLHGISVGFPGDIERALRHHEKKEQLSKLSTEELRKIEQRNREAHAAFSRSIIAREESGEEIGDSAFEAPSIDSEEHIVFELLKEREAKRSTPLKPVSVH